MKTNVKITLTIAALSLITFTSCKENKKEQNSDHENHTEMSHDNADNNLNGEKMSATLKSSQNEYFEVILNDYLNLKDLIKNNKKEVEIDDFSKIKLKSGKKVVCVDKIYESYFDLNNRKNLDHFFVDLEFFRVYTEGDE